MSARRSLNSFSAKSAFIDFSKKFVLAVKSAPQKSHFSAEIIVTPEPDMGTPSRIFIMETTRRLFRTFLVFSLFSGLFQNSRTALRGGLPSEGQVRRLVDAALKDPPPKIRLVVSSELSRRVRSEQSIRDSVEWIYRKTAIARPPQTEEERRQAVDGEVARLMDEQRNPLLLRRQFFHSKHQYRLDQVIRFTGIKPEPETPFERRFVITGDTTAGDYGHFELNYQNKVATLDDKESSMFAQEDLWLAGGLGYECSLIVRGAVMNNDFILLSMGRYEVDPRKIKALSDGTHETYLLSVTSTNLGDVPVDRFELFVRNREDQPFLVMVCDRSDYARAHRIIIRDPHSGKLTKMEERSRFDAAGFPRRWILEEYSDNGTKHTDEHIFEEVDLAPDFPDEEIFGLKVPEDWVLIDNRPDPPVITMGGKPVKTMLIPGGESKQRGGRKSILLSLAITLSVMSLGFLIRKSKTISGKP